MRYFARIPGSVEKLQEREQAPIQSGLWFATLVEGRKQHTRKEERYLFFTSNGWLGVQEVCWCWRSIGNLWELPLEIEKPGWKRSDTFRFHVQGPKQTAARSSDLRGVTGSGNFNSTLQGHFKGSDVQWTETYNWGSIKVTVKLGKPVHLAARKT